MCDEASLAGVTSKVIQIVTNMENGDGIGIQSLHMFINSPLDLVAKGAVTVFASNLTEKDKNHNLPSATSTRTIEDFKIFTKLVSQNFIGKSKEYETPEAAVPALITSGVADGCVPATEADRLVDLFKVWLRSVPWSKCRMNGTNLGSKKGCPWDEQNVAARSLNRNLTGSNVSVKWQAVPFSTTFPPSFLSYSLELWTEANGRCVDLERAIRRTYRAYRALHDTTSRVVIRSKGIGKVSTKSKSVVKKSSKSKVVSKIK
jgi:hypothetical protein